MRTAIYSLWFFLFSAGFVFVAIGLVGWMPFFSGSGSPGQLDFIGVIVFITIGILSLLGARWIEKRLPPSEAPSTVALDHGDVSFIKRILIRERRLNLVAGIVSLAFVALMLIAGTHGNEGQEPPSPLLIALIVLTLALMGGFGVASLYRAYKLRGQPERSLIYKVLTQTPHLVEGITVHLIQHRDAPGDIGLAFLVELEVQGRKLRVRVSKHQLSLLKQYMKLHAPQASYCEKKMKV